MKLEFNSIEELKDFLSLVNLTGDKKTLNVDSVNGPMIKEQTSAPVQASVAPTTQAPVKASAAPTTQVPVAPVTTPAQTAPVAQAPVVPAAPVATPTVPAVEAPVVPTAAPTYTLDDIARAGMTLMDSGRQAELLDLLTNKFGVQALPALPKEQYGAFATALRELGAQI